MADSSLGTAVLRTRLDSSGLQSGLTKAKADTQAFAKDSITAVQGIGAAVGAIAASQGVRAYVRFLTSTASLAQQADASTRLFEKSLNRTNQSLTSGAGLVQRLSDRFGVANTVIEQSATLLLRQGASLDDIDRALTAAGASAAAAGFDISTAFDNVATAVATGRSELLETSGIVTNLGPVTQAYARSIGKTVEELTQAEIIQARVNAIYKETASEIEDVDEILRGLPKAQADWTRELRTFQESAGGLARDVLLPITEAGTNILRFINDLPEPVKRAGTAMSGAAIGATALSTGIFAIRTAMSGLSALGLASFGPAGWIILGTTAVAGLVAVLTGRQNSLDAAVTNASKALASGDTESLTGALEEVIEKVDGPVKTTLVELQDELRETGDVGVDAAQRIGAALAEAVSAKVKAERFVIEAELAALRRARDDLQLNAGLQPVGDLPRLQAELRQVQFELQSAGADLGSADPERVRALAQREAELQTEIGMLKAAAEGTEGVNAALAEYNRQIAELETRLAGLPGTIPTTTPAPTPRPTGTTPTGTPSDPVSVSIDDIRAVNFGRADEDPYPRTRTGANLRAFLARELGITPFAGLPQGVPLDPGAFVRFGGVHPLGITPHATVGGAVRLDDPAAFARLLLGGPELQERDLGRVAQAQQEANDSAAEAARLAVAAEEAWRNNVLFARGQSARYGTQAALDARTRQALIQSFGITPDQLAFGASYQGFRPRETGPTDKAFIENFKTGVTEAGDNLAETVIGAGRGFLSTIDAFRDGNIGAGIAGLGSSAAGLIGLIPGAGQAAQIVTGVFGLVGDLLGLTGGRQREDEERRRTAEARRNQVSALEFNFYFSQSNTFQGDMTNSANQAKLREAGILTFRDFEQTIRRSILPELENLKAKVAALT